MEKLTLEAVYLHEKWCSPVVGRFYPASINTHQNQTVIGRICHFGHTYDLIIPNHTRVRVIHDGETSVEYGTPVAVPCEDVSSSQTETPSEEVISITAPCDGYLRVLNASGAPLRTHGDIIHYGDILAVIEVMKLGIDILYDRQEDAVFLNYQASHTVRQGDVVCTLKNRTHLFRYFER